MGHLTSVVRYMLATYARGAQALHEGIARGAKLTGNDVGILLWMKWEAERLWGSATSGYVIENPYNSYVAGLVPLHKKEPEHGEGNLDGGSSEGTNATPGVNGPDARVPG